MTPQAKGPQRRGKPVKTRRSPAGRPSRTKGKRSFASRWSGRAGNTSRFLGGIFFWPAALILVLALVVLAWWSGSIRLDADPANHSVSGPVSVPPQKKAAHQAAPPPSPEVTPPPYEEPLPNWPVLSPQERVLDTIHTVLAESGVHDIFPGPAPADPKLAGMPSIAGRLAEGQSLASIHKRLENELAALRLAGLSQVWRENGGGSYLEVLLDGGGEVRLLLLPAAREPSSPTPEPRKTVPPPPGTLRRASLVIDDVGYNLGAARKLMDLGVPVTLSILPYSTNGSKVAREASAKGLEVLLHLPMEPRSYPSLKPGPGALLTSMDAPTLARITRENLSQVPGARGVNNHMGSSFTEHGEALGPVFHVLKEQNLFFLDSVTSGSSQVEKAAQAAGIPVGKRTLFLDHDQGEKAVTVQMERFLRLSRQADGVIAIGHPHPATLRVLARYAPRLKREVKLVPVSELILCRP